MGVDDPLSYAYNREMVPRPYAPQLAVVLTKLAEQRLQEQAERKKEEPPEIPELVIGYPPKRMHELPVRHSNSNWNNWKCSR